MMKKHYFNLLAAISFPWLLSSCGVTLKTESPAVTPLKEDLPATESYMNIPVRINLQDLANTANSKVPFQLYKQNGINAASNVKVNLEVKRRGRISITTTNGNINTSIPIHIQGEAFVSVKACSICPKIGRNQSFSTDLTVMTSTKLGIDSHWNIKTHTNADFTLDKAPCINVFGIPVCFESLTREKLKEQLPRINAMINERIDNAYNLKSNAEKYWAQLSQPVQVLNNPVNVWAVFQPTGFNFAPPASDNINNMVLNLGLKTKVRTVVGDKPNAISHGTLPPIQNIQAKDNHFEINVPVAVQLNEIKKIVKQEVVGKTFNIPNSKRNVLVRDMDIIGSNKTLIVKLNIKSKNTKGDVYILADPVFDNKTKTLSVENLKFDSKTNNVIANKAAWLAGNVFVKSIEKKITYNLSKDIDKMRAQAEQSINSLHFSDMVALNAKIQGFDIQSISFDSGNAYLNTRIEGEMNVSVK